MSRTVTFHYARPLEDFDGWRLIVRADEDHEFSPEPDHDAFGLVWRFDFADDAPALRYRLESHDQGITDPDGRGEQVVDLESEDQDVELWYAKEFAVDGEAHFLDVALSHRDDIRQALRNLRADVWRLTDDVAQLDAHVDRQHTLAKDLADRLAKVEQISVAHATELQDVQLKTTNLDDTVDVLVKLSTTPVVTLPDIPKGDLTPLAERARDAVGVIGPAVVAALDDFTGGVSAADLIAALNRPGSRPHDGDVVIGEAERLLFAMASTADLAQQRFTSVLEDPDVRQSLLPVTFEAEIRELGRYYTDTVQHISELDEMEPDRLRAQERLVERLHAPALGTAISQLRGAQP